MTTIMERFNAHGFLLEQTGGNCTAYSRRDPDGFVEMVTLKDDPTAPEDLDDLVVVSLVDDRDGEVSVTPHLRLAHLLDLLEDPAREDALLNLRVENDPAVQRASLP